MNTFPTINVVVVLIALVAFQLPALNAQDKQTTKIGGTSKGHQGGKEASVGKTPGNVQLCSASYSAQQVPGAVFIHAKGFHSTSRYVVFFEQLPPDIFPPFHALWHVEPSGITNPMITPFSEWTSFEASRKVEEVVVFDANGRHVVPVEQVPDAELRHKDGQAGGKDGEEPGTEQKFVGESKKQSAEEALRNALKQLEKAMQEQGIPDNLATWKVVAVDGELGGIAGRDIVRVTISATFATAQKATKETD